MHNMTKQVLMIITLLFPVFAGHGEPVGKKKPLIVITDLYHPYQDPGDNLDLLNGFSLPGVDLKAVILDITDSFRKDTADHPALWKDPRGPREAGIIPVMQLNSIFNRQVKFAVGPVKCMRSETDKMSDTPDFFQGVELLMDILRQENEPIEILSFGSARIIAVAYNRDPELLKRKIKRVHLSAGTAAPNYDMGSDQGANMIPGGEWNVALDVFAFTRLLRSSLPIALYPCAGKDGGFVKDKNNTYWKLKDMSFLREMHPQLQCYLDFAFGKKLNCDFLKAMEQGSPYKEGAKIQFAEFHVWESAVWIEATNRILIKDKAGNYKLIRKNERSRDDVVLPAGLRACKFTEIRDDGRFLFKYVDSPTSKSIFYRPDPEGNEAALNAVIPDLLKSFSPDRK